MASRVEIPFAGSWQISDNREQAVARRITDLIHQRDDAFTRNDEIGHVTGSAVVVDQSRSHILLTHHRKLDRWLQLGGHCDGIRDPWFVAKKEAYEESGLTCIKSLGGDILDIDIHTIPARGDIPEHLHFDIRYLFEADRLDPLVISSESKDLRWIPLDELAVHVDDDSVLRLVKKIQQHQ